MTLTNVTNGFHATGIWPYDRTAIPEEAYAPSLVTHQDYDSDDDKPLAVRLATLSSQNGNKIQKQAQKSSPFQEMMPTPHKIKNKKSAAPRNKAINYKAQQLTRNLFGAMPNEKQPNETEGGIVPINDPSTSEVQLTSSLPSSEANWYCAVCEEEHVADMRVCHNCRIWVHEECVGLTKHDKEIFFCAQCS